MVVFVTNTALLLHGIRDGIPQHDASDGSEEHAHRDSDNQNDAAENEGLCVHGVSDGLTHFLILMSTIGMYGEEQDEGTRRLGEGIHLAVLVSTSKHNEIGVRLCYKLLERVILIGALVLHVLVLEGKGGSNNVRPRCRLE